MQRSSPSLEGTTMKTLPQKRPVLCVGVLGVLTGLHKPRSAFWTGPHWQMLGVTAITLGEGKPSWELNPWFWSYYYCAGNSP